MRGQPAQPMVINGPFMGVNELMDPRQINSREFAQAHNAVCRFGRIAPRPGFSDKSWASSTAWIKVAPIGVNTFSDYCVAQGNGTTDQIVFYNRTDGKFYYQPYDGGTPTSCGYLAAAIGTLRDMDWNTTGDILYWSDRATGKIIRAPRVAGATTDTATGEGLVDCVAYDSVNSRVIFHTATGGGKIRRCDAHGTDANKNDVCSETAVVFVGLTVAPVAREIWWIIGDWVGGLFHFYLKKCDLVGAGVTTVADLGIFTVTAGPCLSADEANIFYVANNGLVKYNIATGTTSGCGSALGSPHRLCRRVVDGRVWLFNEANNWLCRIIPDATYSRCVSSWWYRRSVLGVVPTGTMADDWVIEQILHTDIEECSFRILFPKRIAPATWRDPVQLICGYQTVAMTGGPQTWVTNNRDAVPTDGSAISRSSGRAAFSFTGMAVNTPRGGVIAAIGDTDIDQPLVFNYCLSDTVFTITNSDVGTFSIEFNGESTQTMSGMGPWNSTAQAVKNALLNLNSIDSVRVVRTGAGPYTYTITMLGAWSSQNTPAMTVTGAGGWGGAIARTQDGGSDTNSWLYCRPAGLPRPLAVTTVAGTGAATWFEGLRVNGAGGALTGAYRYKCTFYSSRWNIESPPTEEFGDPALAGVTVMHLTAGVQYATILINVGLPASMYFSPAYGGFMHIDKVRIYRRRCGNAGVFPLDGIGQESKFKFIAEVDIQDYAAGTAIYTDLGAVPDGEGTDSAPVQNEYPPSNAAFVSMADDRAFYCSMIPGDHLLWYSEGSKIGGIADGELGGEYVSNSSFTDVAQHLPSDANFTGLFGGYGTETLVGTTDKPLVATLVNNDLAGEIFDVQPLPGATGIASHWCIAEAQSMPDGNGYLIWIDPRGWIYKYSGGVASRINAKLSATAATTIRRHWHDVTHWDSGLDYSWYYATLILDPQNNRIIASTFDTSANGVCMVMSMDMDADSGLVPSWTTWDIKGWGWVLGRDQDTGADAIYFGGTAGKFCMLEDGESDDGTSFTMTLKTKRFDAGVLCIDKLWHEFVAVFERRVFWGLADATVALTPYARNFACTGSGLKTLTVGATPPEDIDRIGVNLDARAKDAQLKIEVPVAENQTHAELMSMMIEFQAVGKGRES